MRQYTMNEPRLQAVKTDKEQQKTINLYCDLDTGEAKEGLLDPKFPWAKLKQLTRDLATLFRVLGRDDLADKALSCCTWLQYLATRDGRRQLHHINACKSRFCPICNKRKAKTMAVRLIKVLKKVREDHKGTQLIFLTLTLENCTGDKLRETLDLLTASWKKLIDRRPVKRAIKGWFRAIEVTYNENEDTYHPHIHAILVVEDGYFSRSGKLYLTHDQWCDMWRDCLQVAYKPIVGIQSTYGKGKRSGKQVQNATAAALEAAKYATKDSDYLDARLPKEKAAEILGVYVAALHRKRMTAMGGWVKDAAAQLALDVEDDSDLVHDLDGDGDLTSETAELLEDYGFHFGVGDYVLTARYANPDYQGSESGTSAPIGDGGTPATLGADVPDGGDG